MGGLAGWFIAKNQVLLWPAFILCSLVLGLLARFGSSGDIVFNYQPWAISALHGSNWPGIDSPWVYPLLAILPMLVPALLPTAAYQLGWLLMVELLFAVAYFFVLRRQRQSGVRSAAWWWLGFMMLFGSLSFTRLDSVAVPLSIIALLIVGTHPTAAGVVLTAATWIKVWPVAFIVAILAVRPQRSFARLVVGLSVMIALMAVLIGSGTNVASFAFAQSDRGLEVGAPVAMFWLWSGMIAPHSAGVVYNSHIGAFEVFGAGTKIAGVIVSVLLVAAAAAVILVTRRARQRGADLQELLVLSSLALLAVFIVFNKVGSPQYMCMLAVPIVAGLAFGQRRLTVPAGLVLLIAFLTQIIFPWYFEEFLALQVWAVLVETIRNALLTALAVWSFAALARLQPVLDADTEALSLHSTIPVILNDCAPEGALS